MPDFPRNRDCHALFRGDSFPSLIDNNLVNGGWSGGSGVEWTTPFKDEPVVTRTDGYACGFILFGSSESSDQYTASTHQSLTYRYSEICSGGWLISTLSYEKYTYASRLIPPLVLINYLPTDRLVFSLRGLWTKEDEWTLSGDPRAPNQYYAGGVVQTPTQATSFYLTLQSYLLCHLPTPQEPETAWSLTVASATRSG